MTDSEIEAMLDRYCEGRGGRLQGLPDLEDVMCDALSEDLKRLHYACRAILREIPDMETLDEQRPTFVRLYALLKLAAISSINLLDAQDPTLPPLELDEPFGVEAKQTTFVVF